MSTDGPASQAPTRREELLELAATLFAERGLRATTVRDIADSAGILSGSLYHHFDSKEEMVDELLRGFLDWLFSRYHEIVATEPNPLERLEGLFMASFEAIEDRHAQVAIFQDEAKRLSGHRAVRLPGRAQQGTTQDVGGRAQPGRSQEGCFRPDLDVELVYRFIRDTVWVAVRWYRPGGPLTADRSAGSTSPSFLAASRKKESEHGYAFGGLHRRRRPHPGRQAQRVARRRAPGRPRRARVARPGRAHRRRPGAVDDVVFGCVDTIGPQAGDIARTSLARRRAARARARHHHRPSVRLVAAGRALRRPGASCPAPHDLVVAGGVQNMSLIPISSAMIVGEQFGFTDPFAESHGWLHRYGDQEISPVPRRRDDRREVGHLPRGHGGSSRSSRHQRAPQARSPRAASSARSSPLDGRRRPTRARARPTLEKMAGAARRSSRAAGSPPRWPARSPTAPARC